MRLPSPFRPTALLCTLAIGVGVGACAQDLDGPSEGPSGYATAADSASLAGTAFGTFNGWLSVSWQWTLMEGSTIAPDYQIFSFVYRRLYHPPTYGYPPDIDLCTSITFIGLDRSGVPVDADGDGWPDDLTVRFGDDCRLASPEGNHSFAITGWYRFRDTAIPGRGYALTMHDLSFTDTDRTNGVTYASMEDGDESLIVTGAQVEHRMDVAFRWASYGGGQVATQSDFRMREHSTLVPDSGTTYLWGDLGPRQATVTSDAEFWIHDRDGVGVPRPDMHLVVTTPTPIHFDLNTCNYYSYGSGVLRGVLQEAPSVGYTLDWNNGCGDPTLTIFGNTE